MVAELPKKTIETMTDSFDDQIREATVVPSQERVQALRQAVKSAATSLGSGDALDLVRVAHRRQASGAAPARVRARLNADSEVLADHRQDQLLATLAAITLIRVFDRPTYVHGLLPALAVRSARAQGWSPVHPDVFTHADFYIRERALAARKAVADADFTQTPKEGEEITVSGEIKAMRSALLKDRSLLQESERLLWWVSSAQLPRSSNDAAVEFNSLLNFVPEPGGTGELFRAKFRSKDSRSALNWNFARPAIPPELQDLCPKLARKPGPEEPDLDEALAGLNELLLIRALKDRPVQQ